MKDMRAISNKSYIAAKVSTLLFTGLFAFMYTFFDVVANVFFVLYKMQVFSGVVFYYSTMVIFGGVVFFLVNDTIGIIISGYLLLRTIRKITKNVKNSSDNSKNPFLVTLALMFGLLSCVFLQIVAACVAVVGDNFKYVWHGINNIGILIFSILALVLFYPVLKNKKSNYITTTPKLPTTNIPDIESTQPVGDAFFTKVETNSESTPSSGLPSPLQFESDFAKI